MANEEIALAALVSAGATMVTAVAALVTAVAHVRSQRKVNGAVANDLVTIADASPHVSPAELTAPDVVNGAAHAEAESRA